MKFFKYLLLTTLFVTLSTATVYESGEDGVSNSWYVYDNKPAGASIDNIYDAKRGGNLNEATPNVIQLKGDGRKNAYFLGAKSGEKAWNNTTEKVINWSMKINEKYKIRVYVTTEKGNRYLYYSHSKRDKGFKKGKRVSYVHHGLGKVSMDDNWHTYSRDLEADLKEYEPDNSIIAVNGFRIHGSAMLDDIELTKERKKLYPEERWYTQDKKYFFATNRTFLYTTSATEWFVVETKTDKITDYEIGRHSTRQTPTFSKVKNLDIFVEILRGHGVTARYYSISKKGKLILLDITPPKEEGHIDNISGENGYISDTRFSVIWGVAGLGQNLKQTYDVHHLPKVKLLSTEVVK